MPPAVNAGWASTARSSGIPVRTPSTANSPSARWARAQAAATSGPGARATTFASSGS